MRSTTTPKASNRALALLRQGAVTLAVVALAGAAVVSGVGFLNHRAEATPEPQAAPPAMVSVQTVMQEDGYTIPRRFIGQVEASTSLSLSFEVAGRLDALQVSEGDPVLAGQEIARLDTELLQAEAGRLDAARAAAAAQLSFAESRLVRALHLQDQGFTSREALDAAQATRDELTNRIAEIEASQLSVAISMRKSVLRAPVSGRIAAQTADVAETVQAGQQIVTLLETARPELRVGLPLDLSAGDLASVVVEIAGQRIPATLTRLRPDIDPVTRTRTALFDIASDDSLLFGQTAALVLETEIPARGIWVPLDALQPGKGSVWTVMVVSDDRLRPATVEPLHVEGARAFVRGGLRTGDRIVLSGAHRVVPGQSVRVAAAGE